MINSDFRTTCDAMSILSFLYAIIFLFTNVGLPTLMVKPHRDEDPIYEKVMAEFKRRQSNVEDPFILEGKLGNIPEFRLDRLSGQNYMNSDQQSNDPLLEENSNQEIQQQVMSMQLKNSLNNVSQDVTQ